MSAFSATSSSAVSESGHEHIFTKKEFARLLHERKKKHRAFQSLNLEDCTKLETKGNNVFAVFWNLGCQPDQT
jgi:hypothetical protein